VSGPGTTPAGGGFEPAGREIEEPVPEAYVVQRVEDALANDDRVGELGLAASVEGNELVVRGAVSNPVRKEGVAPVAREVVDALQADLSVRDETDVPPNVAPEGEEVVR
jgi:hypothetical protein